jgi:hypothetical protein
MTDAHDIARATAMRLAPQFGKDLPLTVEKVIHGAAEKPGQFIDMGALALAGFIVQCANFAFTVYINTIGKEKPDAEALKRTVRLEVKLPEGVSEKTRDTVISAVVEEVQNAKDKT